MNENVDYFKDANEQIKVAIEKAIFQAEIIGGVLPSKAMDNLLKELGIIKSLYPPDFKQLIVSQCVENGKMPEQKFYLHIGGDTCFKVTVELERTEPPANAKKKWYQF